MEAAVSAGGFLGPVKAHYIERDGAVGNGETQGFVYTGTRKKKKREKENGGKKKKILSVFDFTIARRFQ